MLIKSVSQKGKKKKLHFLSVKTTSPNQINDMEIEECPPVEERHTIKMEKAW